MGKRTKSTPMGSIDRPFSPVALALGAGATFVARSVDSDVKHVASMLERAAAHKGTAFVEILQNCVVFNDDAYGALSNKATRADAGVFLEHGKPLVFGKDRNKGIKLSGWSPELVTLGENAVSEADLVVHDEKAANGGLAFFLSQLENPQFPVPLGVFRDLEEPAYEELNKAMAEGARAAKGPGDLGRLLNGSETWTIK